MRQSALILVVLLSAMLFANPSFAQDAPGGVATGLKLWLRADAGVTELNGVATAWTDQSGNSYDFSDAGNSPYLYDSRGLNYNPELINPDGSNRRLTNTSSISLRTVILVTDPDNPNKCDNPFSEAGADDEGIRACVNSAIWRIPGNGDDFTRGNGQGWFNGAPAIDPTHNSLPNIVIVEAPSLANFAGGIELGDSKLSRYWHGSIAEVIGYEGILEQADREKIETYLAIKYGITLSHDYIASDGTTLWDATSKADYNNDLAGIGRDDASTLNQKQSVNQLAYQLESGVAIGLGSITVDNSSNNDHFADDGSFLIWGHDNGSLFTSIPFSGTDASFRMARTWTVQELGTVGTVEVRIPEAFQSNYLLVSSSSEFTAATEYALADNGDGTWSATVDFSNGDFFTFDGSTDASLSASPETIFFGDMSIYQSGITRELVIENTAASSIQITSVEITGRDSSQFSVESGDISDPISSGSIASFSIRATPTPFPSPYLEARLEINSEAGSITIPLFSTARMPSTFYVNPSGSDLNSGTQFAPWQTIQHAVDRAVPQDTILVEDGMYEGPIIMTRSGEPDAYITLKSINTWGAKIEVIEGEGPEDGIKVASNYITIDGFELYDVAPGPGRIGNGITIYEAHHVNVLNNKVYDFGASGIQGAFCDHVLIENNVVYENAKYNPTQSSGISIWQAWAVDDAPGYHLIVRNNRSFRNTTITKNAGGKNTDGTGIIIDRLRTSIGGQPFPHRTLVENNLVYDNGGSGIHIFASNHVDIFNNTAYHNRHNEGITGTFRGDLYTNSSTDTIWRNNIAFANPGPGVTAFNRAIFANRATDVVYENNITYSTNAENTFSISILNSDLTEEDIINSNFVGMNPQFIDAENRDFSLRPSSPAIDAGSDEIASLTDINYLTRTAGPIDVGAFEYFDVALQVELTAFEALVDGQDIQLNWITASELNTAGFAVELRDSESDFEEVYFMDGQGTTSTESIYEATLQDVDPGVYTLRLKKIGLDGSFIYSDEIEAVIDENLPVELTSFEAFAAGEDIQLRWTTASELNNAGFAIELSTEEQDFEQVSFVEGQGTTDRAQRYETILHDVHPGTYSLRLKQIDFDGTFAFSEVIEIAIGATDYHLAQSYPNPFNPQTLIRYTLPVGSHVKLEVFDLLGRNIRTLVNEEQVAGVYSVRFDGQDLSNGTYVYRLTAGAFTETKSMILLK